MKTCKIVYNTSFTKDSTKIIVRNILEVIFAMIFMPSAFDS